MPDGTDQRTASTRAWGRRQLEGALPMQPGARQGHGREDRLPVTIVAADAVQRRRLAEALASVEGIVVVGWAESAPALAALGACAGPAVVVAEGAAAGSRLRGPVAIPPRLSRRQREVLIAYAAGNELLEVVARQLGLTPETLKTHLRRVRAKYRQVGRPAPTRRDLFVRAVEDGLLPPPC